MCLPQHPMQIRSVDKRLKTRAKTRIDSDISRCRSKSFDYSNWKSVHVCNLYVHVVRH